MITHSPVVSGSLCYALYQQQVLLLRRINPPHQGLWTPPGGKMEFGESPQDCCIREMQEETGITISSPELRAIQSVADHAVPVHWQLFIFRVKLTEQSIPNHHPDHDEGEKRWFAFDELATIQRPYPDTLYWSHLIGDHPTIWQGKFVYDTPHHLLHEEIYAL